MNLCDFQWSFYNLLACYPLLLNIAKNINNGFFLTLYLFNTDFNQQLDAKLNYREMTWDMIELLLSDNNWCRPKKHILVLEYDLYKSVTELVHGEG